MILCQSCNKKPLTEGKSQCRSTNDTKRAQLLYGLHEKLQHCQDPYRLSAVRHGAETSLHLDLPLLCSTRNQNVAKTTCSDNAVCNTILDFYNHLLKAKSLTYAKTDRLQMFNTWIVSCSDHHERTRG